MLAFFLKYFTPLDKGSCIYFLIISAIFFVLLILTLFGQIFVLLKNPKRFNFRTISGGIIILFNIFLAYFVNRLLYSMCTKSLA